MAHPAWSTRLACCLRPLAADTRCVGVREWRSVLDASFKRRDAEGGSVEARREKGKKFLCGPLCFPPRLCVKKRDRQLCALPHAAKCSRRVAGNSTRVACSTRESSPARDVKFFTRGSCKTPPQGFKKSQRSLMTCSAGEDFGGFCKSLTIQSEPAWDKANRRYRFPSGGGCEFFRCLPN